MLAARQPACPPPRADSHGPAVMNRILAAALLSLLASCAQAQDDMLGTAAEPITRAALHPKLRGLIDQHRDMTLYVCDGVVEYRVLDNNGHVHVRYYDNKTARLLCRKNSITAADCGKYWKCP
jgi:hypothetical protein